MSGLVGLDPAERHRVVCARFAGLVEGVADWSAPTPVPEWCARDVVGHLVGWLPGFVAGFTSARLPDAAVDVAVDPVGAWRAHAAAVQALLDDPAVAASPAQVPGGEEQPLADVLDRFWTTDVLMHAWDLARASGQDDRLDEDWVAATLPGMEAMEPVLRSSGQFGSRVPVPDDAPAQDRLLGLIGRDPAWRPPARG